MNAAQVLEGLYHDGLHLWAEGDRVVLLPREKATPEAIELICVN